MYPEGEPGVADLGLRHFVAPLDVEAGVVTSWRWWHDCPAVRHVSWGWFGRGPDLASGHRITSTDPLSVQGSLICPDCGDHGFIEGGRWRAA